MTKQWIAVVVALAALCLTGCDGTGGVGGQGICLRENTDCTVTITINDGGTGLPNPLGGDGGIGLANPLPAYRTGRSAAGIVTEKTPPVTSGEPSPAAP